MKKILIVKHGALGDVVRTSYFAGGLRRKYCEHLHLTWITSSAAYPLIANNPNIDSIVTSFDGLRNTRFDSIYSLDDELEIVTEVCKLNTNKVIGAQIVKNLLTYSDDCSEWFDMGLLSRFGKLRADELKRKNIRSHGKIFEAIFGVSPVVPEFFLSAEESNIAQNFLAGNDRLLGINPYAGGRWPSKEINDQELYKLIKAISDGAVFSTPVTVVLFGANDDRLRNENLARQIKATSPNQEIIVANTDDSVMKLAAYISRMNLMISSDSLGMHLSIAQGVPTIAFFSPTSAAEIDSFGICQKVISTSPDYCSYSKVCDNSTITADRIVEKIQITKPLR